MRAIQLTGAITDPQHVCRAIVIVVGQAVAPHKGFFVIEQQRFVGGEETGFAQLRRAVHAAGAHERQGFIDAPGQLAVLVGKRRVGDEVQVPLVHLMQIGKPALCERAQQVQGGGGLVVSLDQALRVRHSAFFVETDAVDDVTPISRERHAIDDFVIGRARLGKLPSHASDLDHRAARSEGHDDRHLQQHLEGVANLRRRKLHEAFGAIAALQQERPALGHLGKLAAQLPCFAGKHQRRIAGQRLFDLQQVRGVRVVRLLLNRQCPPAVGAPGLAHYWL